jgi:hypothetical protein
MGSLLALRKEKVPSSNILSEFVFFLTKPVTPLELPLEHQMWRKKRVCLTIHLT